MRAARAGDGLDVVVFRATDVARMIGSVAVATGQQSVARAPIKRGVDSVSVWSNGP